VAVLEPGQLAGLLDEWALKREKVLRLLDLRAANRARALIGRCMRLEHLGFSPLLNGSTEDPMVMEWLDIRVCVVELLRPGVELATGS
jgi:hypothetical protein